MEFRTPWESDPEPAEGKGVIPPPLPTPPKRRGRRPKAIAGVAPAKPAAAPDWLYHHLMVIGPAEILAEFATAARGAGVVPWRLDGRIIEEDVFNLAASQPIPPRRLTIDGCRILARQFRDRVEARHAKALALVGHSRACPFDLQELLPVPAAILELGPADPASLAWLRERWGMTDTPRKVVERSDPVKPRSLPDGHAAIGYGFFTAGETPHAAIAVIASRWPALRFELQARPD
jgi:hypothetical protein